jgi:uroporphyrinogen decarboxylase
MNSRERIFAAISHKQPDRAPVFATLTPQVAEKLAKALKLPPEPPLDSLLSTRISHTGLLTRMGNDGVGIAACSPKGFPTRKLSDGTLVNEWGMKFKPFGLYNEFYGYPLAGAETEADIAKYKFPDPLAEGRYDAAKETVRKYGKDYAVFGDLECSIYETSWYLVGLEKFLMDLTLGRPYLFALMDRILQISIETGRQLIKVGADVIWAGDDFGGQGGMIMSPEMWRRIFKPRIKQMFDEFRKAKPDIKLAWHSCGSIIPIIPDFIEIGLDILNPIQPLAAGMEPKFLKKTFGKDLTFFGGIDLQELMPYGTVQQVKEEVTRRINILGKGGGYIVAPAHNIQDDTPLQNIFAMYEAVKEAG